MNAKGTQRKIFNGIIASSSLCVFFAPFALCGEDLGTLAGKPPQNAQNALALHNPRC
jgi:hypothetical protein